ncbi:MAG: ATP-dependent DNA helicase, partial [Candidatus Diapherotrites archaeon]|nr:ATP-dependent DNA helicase [Candidatus Diapherotrites archaeon]
ALENIEDNSLISTNFLRYVVYKYLTENEVLNYSDEYLVGTIVPKLENLMRYLKNYGVLPNSIDREKSKAFLEDSEKFTKEELALFLDKFVEMFSAYETAKSRKGIDYTDMLINFLNSKHKPLFDFVLVDELQDVNSIEADIALSCGKNFFVVGDKKQAIFGFQGGSISNFSKFDKCREERLIENFRSTNQILEYAKNYFIKNTQDKQHKEDLAGLKNHENKTGNKPVIIEATNVNASIVDLVKEWLPKTLENEQIAIIVRTNYQIAELASVLSSNGIEFSTTFFASSKEAKENIIKFLKGVFSNNIEDIKASMFTPYFPCSIQQAFEKAGKKDLVIQEIYQDCPIFKEIRDSIKSIDDIEKLFLERILPVSFAHGEEYVQATLTLQEACREAINTLDNKSLEQFVLYLNAVELLGKEPTKEKKVLLTTVHKAKGREFETAIYAPTKIKAQTGFANAVAEAILKSKKINAKEELEEEDLRIDFVAFTRAKQNLFIATEKALTYLTEDAAIKKSELLNSTEQSFQEKQKKAYSLFVNKQYNQAKELLEKDNKWLREFVENHFKTMEKMSFSRVTSDAYEYLLQNILGFKESTYSTNLGSLVHKQIKEILQETKLEIGNETKPFVDNALELIKEIKKNYPELYSVEEEIKVPLSEITGTENKIMFKGVIDAVFKNNNEYLIVDWKTSKDTGSGAEHRQQLEVYKRIFSKQKNIPEQKIKVNVAYIGLRNKINDGKIYKELNQLQPRSTAFDTIAKKINKILSWKSNPQLFFEELAETKRPDNLLKSVIEQLELEKQLKVV